MLKWIHINLAPKKGKKERKNESNLNKKSKNFEHTSIFFKKTETWWSGYGRYYKPNTRTVRRIRKSTQFRSLIERRSWRACINRNTHHLKCTGKEAMSRPNSEVSESNSTKNESQPTMASENQDTNTISKLKPMDFDIGIFDATIIRDQIEKAERHGPEKIRENHRLVGLAILSIESRLAREVSYDDIINDFTQKKARKANFIQKESYPSWNTRLSTHDSITFTASIFPSSTNIRDKLNLKEKFLHLKNKQLVVCKHERWRDKYHDFNYRYENLNVTASSFVNWMLFLDVSMTDWWFNIRLRTLNCSSFDCFSGAVSQKGFSQDYVPLRNKRKRQLHDTGKYPAWVENEKIWNAFIITVSYASFVSVVKQRAGKQSTGKHLQLSGRHTTGNHPKKVTTNRRLSHRVAPNRKPPQILTSMLPKKKKFQYVQVPKKNVTIPQIFALKRDENVGRLFTVYYPKCKMLKNIRLQIQTTRRDACRIQTIEGVKVFADWN